MNPEDNGEQLLADLRKRVKAMAAGDKSTLPQIHRFLESLPDAVDMFGDLACNAEEALIQMASGKDLLTREALKRKAAAIKAEVSGPKPSGLERLLAERIAACWLQVNHADIMCAQNLGKTSIEMGEFLRRRQDSAHKRYTSAIKALSQVRRLLVPIVQLNVAQQQVVANAPQVIR